MQHPVLRHMKEHVWLWVAGCTILGVLAILLNQATPGALLFMLAGVLIILKSQGADLLSIVTTDPLSGDNDDEVEEVVPANDRGTAAGDTARQASRA